MGHGNQEALSFLAQQSLEGEAEQQQIVSAHFLGQRYSFSLCHAVCTETDDRQGPEKLATIHDRSGSFRQLFQLYVIRLARAQQRQFLDHHDLARHGQLRAAEFTRGGLQRFAC